MRGWFLAMVIACVIAPGRASGDKPTRALAVIVAKGSKITALSSAELKRAFSGDAVVVDDQRLIPFNYPPGSTERVGFDRAVLDMSEAEVGRFWVDRKIRGEGEPPRALPTALHVHKIVARFPGAIGYLPLDQLTPDVVAIKIDGLLPSARGYSIFIQ